MNVLIAVALVALPSLSFAGGWLACGLWGQRLEPVPEPPWQMYLARPPLEPDPDND